MKLSRFILPLLAAVFTANTAFGSLYLQQVVDPNVPDGCVACAIMWNGGGTNDWTSAGIVIDLVSGSAYQDQFESPGGAPPPAAFIPAFPSLAFDTHVGIIGDGSAGIAGGAGDLGGGPQSQNAPQISLSWFNTDSGNTGEVQIGMITLTDDAQGTWSMVSQGVVTSGTLIDGNICIPEPSTLALLGLGGLAVLRRR